MMKIMSILCFLMMFSFLGFAGEIENSLSKKAIELTQNLLETQPKFQLNELYNSDLFDSSYLPIDLEVRDHSLEFEQLSDYQSKIILDIVSDILSHEGYTKFLLNLMLDQKYRAMNVSKNTNHILKFYGNPQKHNWGMKFEGYHISLTLMIEYDQIKFINLFLGQDTQYLHDVNYDIYPLYDYGRYGFDLIDSLSAKQMQKAFLDISTPTDIMNKPNYYMPHLKKRSLNSSKLKKKQISILKNWINTYTDLIYPELMQGQLEKLEENKYKDISLAWSGSFEKEHSNYYYFIFNHNFIVEFNLRPPHLHNIVRIKFN